MAASNDFDFGGDVEDGSFTVDGNGSSSAPARDSSSEGPVGPQFVLTSVPACSGNNPSTENADVFCAEADALCSAPGQAMYWVYSSPDVQPRSWTYVGQRCQGARDPAAPRPVFPGFTLADFQRLPLPAGTPNVEPDNGYTLVNIPTNVYAEAAPVTLGTQLIGFPVQVRATPSRFAWTFGDGGTHGPTEEAGAPYPALTITHDYARSGTYPITLTTYYSGEYSVAGGPWLPIAGEAQVRSAPVAVEALSGRNRLVAGDAKG
jgi:hypothetical protein